MQSLADLLCRIAVSEMRRQEEQTPEKTMPHPYERAGSAEDEENDSTANPI
jgi:hypothetical protein